MLYFNDKKIRNEIFKESCFLHYSQPREHTNDKHRRTNESIQCHKVIRFGQRSNKFNYINTKFCLLFVVCFILHS